MAVSSRSTISPLSSQARRVICSYVCFDTSLDARAARARFALGHVLPLFEFAAEIFDLLTETAAFLPIADCGVFLKPSEAFDVAKVNGDWSLTALVFDDLARAIRQDLDVFSHRK